MLTLLTSKLRAAPVTPLNYVDLGTFDSGKYSFTVQHLHGLENQTRMHIQARIRGTRHTIRFNATYAYHTHSLAVELNDDDHKAMLNGPREHFDEYHTLAAWQRQCLAHLSAARKLPMQRAA